MLVGGAVVAVVLQAACGGWLEVRGARPDLVLALVVGAGLLAGWRLGLITGAAAGWCALALTPGHSWYWVPLYAGAGGLTGLVSHPLSRESPWWHALLVLAAAVAVNAAAVAVDGSSPASAAWLWPSCLYSGVIAPPVFVIMQRVWTRLA